MVFDQWEAADFQPYGEEDNLFIMRIEFIGLISCFNLYRPDTCALRGRRPLPDRIPGDYKAPFDRASCSNSPKTPICSTISSGWRGARSATSSVVSPERTSTPMAPAL